MKHLSKAFLGALLRQHEAELISQWESMLSFKEQFALFRVSENVQKLLKESFRDLMSVWLEGGEMQLGHVCNMMPIYAPEAMVHALIVGEDVCVELIKKYATSNGAEWPAIRSLINQAFRQMIIVKLPPFCACCARTMQEEMVNLHKLTSDLKKAHAGSCGNLKRSFTPSGKSPLGKTFKTTYPLAIMSHQPGTLVTTHP